MPVLIIGDEQKKVACSSCIRGHRATSCFHLDRVLVEVRKGGRPMNVCLHPRGTCPPDCSQQPAYAIPGHAQACACPGEPIRDATILDPEEVKQKSQRPDKHRRKSKARPPGLSMQGSFPAGTSVSASAELGKDSHNALLPTGTASGSCCSGVLSAPVHETKPSCCSSSKTSSEAKSLGWPSTSNYPNHEPSVSMIKSEDSMPSMSSSTEDLRQYISGPQNQARLQAFTQMNSLPTFDPHSAAYSYDIGQFHPTGFGQAFGADQPLNAVPIVSSSQLRDNCVCGPDCQCLGCLSHYLEATNPTMAHVQETWQLQETEAYQRESQELMLAYNQGIQQQFSESVIPTYHSQSLPIPGSSFLPVFINHATPCGMSPGLCKCGDGCLCSGCILHTGHDNVPVDFEGLDLSSIVGNAEKRSLSTETEEWKVHTNPENPQLDSLLLTQPFSEAVLPSSNDVAPPGWSHAHSWPTEHAMMSSESTAPLLRSYDIVGDSQFSASQTVVPSFGSSQNLMSHPLNNTAYANTQLWNLGHSDLDLGTQGTRPTSHGKGPTTSSSSNDGTA